MMQNPTRFCKQAILYVDTTTDKLTKIRTPRRFCKTDQMNCENLPQQI